MPSDPKLTRVSDIGMVSLLAYTARNDKRLVLRDSKNFRFYFILSKQQKSIIKKLCMCPLILFEQLTHRDVMRVMRLRTTCKF